MKALGTIEILIGVGLVGLALSSALWVLSSSHLAHDFCNGNFSLFHEYFRCRQPYIAMILAFGSIVGAIAALVYGVIHVRSD